MVKKSVVRISILCSIFGDFVLFQINFHSALFTIFEDYQKKENYEYNPFG